MARHDPEKNFEKLWRTFLDRYPFFKLRRADWKKQYDRYRPKVTRETSKGELFDILCEMLDPLDDGHVELTAKIKGKKRFFTAEKPTRFSREFTRHEVEQLFETTGRTLVANGFGRPERTAAWMLHYCRSPRFAYVRILELEDIKKRKLTAALDRIARDFADLAGFIIDIRNCPGGEDDIAIRIINRFCDRRRIAFHRRSKIGPGKGDLTPVATWYLEPAGRAQFTGPIILLTCDAVFSGGEAFALAIRQLPHVTIIGDRTNGIFSYTLDKRLPNGWRYCLSHQIYFSADMTCYEGRGVPPDIKLLNSKTDIANGSDPLIDRALQELRSRARGGA